jgi:very-short-patch-repair endonuclease
VHSGAPCGQRAAAPRGCGTVPPVRPPLVPEQLRTEVFRGSWAVGTGLLTWRQLEGRTWRRLLHDVYVHAGVPVTHLLRCHASCLLLPEAVVTGVSAAVLWGVDLAGPSDDVEVTLPPTAGPRRLPGLKVRRARISDDDRWRRLDLPVTTPAATAVRLAASLPGDDGVVAVDQLVASGVVDLAPIRALAARARGTGSARARAVCDRADGLAGSPQETRLRLLMRRCGLPDPVAQFRVMAGGVFVARVDFAWPDRKVAVEYDGLWHADDGQFAKDRRRLNRLREAGWTVVFVTAADMHRPDELIARIAAALA